MKNIFLILMLFCAFFASAQDGSRIVIPTSSVEQSSTAGRRVAHLAIDPRVSSYAKTKVQENPWYKIDLEDKHYISDIALNGRGLNGVYIFFSELPFVNNDIWDLLEDPVNKYLYLENYRNGNAITADLLAKNILIISTSPNASLTLNDIRVNAVSYTHLTLPTTPYV